MRHNKVLKRIVCSFFLIFPAVFNECSADTHSSLEKLDSYIQNQIKEDNAVGCAVAVVENGKVVFMKAYGVLKKGGKDPVNLDTVFQLGSISKPISATLVALLVKAKLIDISKGTAIHNVLSHTTGYSRAGWNQKIEEGLSRELMLKQLMDAEQSPPGQHFDYHNFVYSLMEEIIVSTLKQPFKKALEEKVFRPLCMKLASAGDKDFETQSNYAWPHQRNKDRNLYPCKDYSHKYHQTVCSAGGINASIKDMAIFLQLQMGAKPNILNAQDLLPFHTPVANAPDALNWMRPRFKGDLKSYYGLGWRILDHDEKRMVFHGGYLKGFISFLAFIPERKIGIVILNNSESSFAADAAMTFFEGD